MSLDCWLTAYDSQHWSYGVTYTDNSVEWMGLFKKICNDDMHVEHYKKKRIYGNFDEFTNYLMKKFVNVKVETFYVENLHMIHNHNNVYNNVYWGLRHWAEGRCYWHTMSESFGMGKAGSLPISEFAIKFDIGLTVEESLRCLKNSCTSNFSIGAVKHFEKVNHVIEETITVILPLDGTVDNIRMCLANLMTQTFQDFRLIVTDAGLSEGALKICKDAQPDFKGRMKIIDGLPKEKLFDAGLEAAKGRYVIFINGGDKFIPQAFQLLNYVIETLRADVIHLSNYFVADKGKTLVKTDEVWFNDDSNIFTNLRCVTEKTLAWANGALTPSIYNKLIRREFLEGEKISLPFADDISQWIFSLQCLMLAENYIRFARPLHIRISKFEPIKNAENFHAHINSPGVIAEVLQKLFDEVLFFDEYSNEKKLLKNLFIKLFR